MPILPKETNLFPSNLLEQDRAELLPGDWHILHTKPNQEKSVARLLLARGVPFFLPLYRKRTIVRGKETYSYSPAFRGYVFLCDRSRCESGQHGEIDIDIAKRTNRLAGILPVDDQQLLLDELRKARRLIGTNAEVSEESLLCPGEYVRVKSGPFEGHEGTIVWRENKKHLLVTITTLQRGLKVELDDCRVERLHREPIGITTNSGGAIGRGQIEW